MVCQHLRCLAQPYLASPSISLPYLAFRCLPLPCPDPLPAPPFPCVAFTKPPLLCLPFRCLAFASADLPCLTLPCLAFLTLPLPYLPHPCLVLCCCPLVLPICPLPFLTDQLFPFLALPTPPLPLFLFGHMSRGGGRAVSSPPCPSSLLCPSCFCVGGSAPRLPLPGYCGSGRALSRPALTNAPFLASLSLGVLLWGGRGSPPALNSSKAIRSIGCQARQPLANQSAPCCKSSVASRTQRPAQQTDGHAPCLAGLRTQPGPQPLPGRCFAEWGGGDRPH